MAIRPILSSLKRHRIAALLIVAEIALACAVLCNAVFMIAQRVAHLRQLNAMDEAGVVYLNLPTVNPNAATDIPRNLAALKGIAGVKAVAITGSIPLVMGGGGFVLSTSADSFSGVDCTLYMMSEGGDASFGLLLLRGRMFTAEEYAASTLRENGFIPNTQLMIVTDAYAKTQWPDQEALGKTLYANIPELKQVLSYTVVGIVADVLTPAEGGQGAVADVRNFDGQAPTGERQFHNGCFLPLSPTTDALSNYVIRTAPENRDRVLREAMHLVNRAQPGAVMTGSSFMDAKDKKLAGIRSMVHTLVMVCVVMLAVTAFGIVGLTSFWVQQRRRQIGIRRALGATRGEILRYFQIENLLLTTAGGLLGMAAAFAINLYLMQQYQMERMPWPYYPVGAAVLCLLGQIAVLGPALRAAQVPPTVAMRSA